MMSKFSFFSVILSLVLVWLLAGCANSSRVVTGPAGSPITLQAVVLYQTPPPRFEFIAVVKSKAAGNRPGQMEAAVRVLKEQAGAMGANGVIITAANAVSAANTRGDSNQGTLAAGAMQQAIELSAKAIYVSSK